MQFLILRMKRTTVFISLHMHISENILPFYAPTLHCISPQPQDTLLKVASVRLSDIRLSVTHSAPGAHVALDSLRPHFCASYIPSCLFITIHDSRLFTPKSTQA